MDCCSLVISAVGSHMMKGKLRMRDTIRAGLRRRQTRQPPRASD